MKQLWAVGVYIVVYNTHSQRPISESGNITKSGEYLISQALPLWISTVALLLYMLCCCILCCCYRC